MPSEPSAFPAASPAPSGRPESPLPKRRRKRRSRVPYPLMIATVVLGGAVVAWCAFLLLAKTLHPYLLGYEENAKLSRMQAHLSRQNAINAGLEKRISYLESSEGRESEARRQGFHRPGETVYLLKPDETTPSPTPSNP